MVSLLFIALGYVRSSKTTYKATQRTRHQIPHFRIVPLHARNLLNDGNPLLDGCFWPFRHIRELLVFCDYLRKSVCTISSFFYRHTISNQRCQQVVEGLGA